MSGHGISHKNSPRFTSTKSQFNGANSQTQPNISANFNDDLNSPFSNHSRARRDQVGFNINLEGLRTDENPATRLNYGFESNNQTSLNSSITRNSIPVSSAHKYEH